MLDIDALLQKDPNVRRVFEQNQATLSKCPPEKKRNTGSDNHMGLDVRLKMRLSANPGQRRVLL